MIRLTNLQIKHLHCRFSRKSHEIFYFFAVFLKCG
jgi:hypothetical protein